MSEYPRDEFDDVPENGARQGAHRGHNPHARAGSRHHFLAVLMAGVLALALGAVTFVNAPRTTQEALTRPSAAVVVSSDDAAAPARAIGTFAPGASASGVVPVVPTSV